MLAEVPIDDWKPWLLFHVLRSAAPYLTDDFVETNFDFYGRTLNGTPELRDAGSAASRSPTARR